MSEGKSAIDTSAQAAVDASSSSAERKAVEDCSDAVVRREWLEVRIENALPRDKSGRCRDNEALKDGLRFARLDKDPEVRSLAAQLLGKVAALGDKQALPVLIALLEDASNVVKAAAGKAVGKVAPQGHAHARAALLSLATLAEGSVAEGSVAAAALRSLRKVAHRGDEEAAACMLAALQSAHAQPALVTAAARSLQAVAVKGDSAIMAALLHTLRTGDSSQVRMASADAAAELADVGDEEVVASLLSYALATQSPVVGELLGRLVGALLWCKRRARPCAPLRCRGRRQVDDEEGCLLKEKCAAGLGRVARRGDAPVVAGLLQAVKGGDYEVQIPSIRALGSVAGVGDAATTAALLELLDDEEVGIRLEAVKALAAVGRRGRQDVVRGVLERLVDRNAAVRTQAVISLGRVAGREDRKAIGALGRIMDDDKQDTNGQMATEALVSIVRSIEDEDEDEGNR